MWAHFIPFLTLILGCALICNPAFVFFFLWPCRDDKRARIARYRVKSILHSVWFFRNKATFHNGNEDHRALIRLVSCDVKKRIFADFSRFSESRFSTLWVLPGFCTVENGLVKVHLTS